MNKQEAFELLDKNGQAHVLNGFDDLSGDLQEGLLKQISQLDFEVLKIANQTSKSEMVEREYAPLNAVSIDDIANRKAEFDQVGFEAIRKGQLAAVLLAGGMGTRLGSDKPKGEVRVGINNDLCIFECLIKNLMEVTDRVGAFVPLYIMTSEKNDEETRRFFAEKNYFGYPKDYIEFFVQEMAAAVDYDGKLLLESPGRLATSPNGNGGWYSSLKRAGLGEDIKRRGVKWLNIFAVDNVLQRIADPTFLGATILSGADSGSKVVRKVDPYEKMGVFCSANGHPAIVEYYELSDEMALAKDEKGDLMYPFGVILNYLFSVERLDEIVGKTLPLHIVEKKIPYMDAEGNQISPTEPNGYKFETLILDMVELMTDSLCFEVVREREFAPIKNLHGVDSLDSARELLEKNGVKL